MGSICGGGRYDDLTGIFGLPGMSGVGISFGVDRIYDVMHELNKFSDDTGSSARIMFLNFGDQESLQCMKYARTLRSKEISAEVYPDNVKVKKQLEYADKKNIPFVAFVGTDEMEKGEISLKRMNSEDPVIKIKPEELEKLLV
jgi:histidyl-tRNA synthetase